MSGGKKGEKKNREKETLRVLIDEPDLEVKEFFFSVTEPQCLFCSGLVGGSGGVYVQYIQLLFHPTELLSAAPPSHSLELCSSTEAKKRRHSKANKEINEEQQQTAPTVRVLTCIRWPPGTPRGALRQCKPLDDIALLLLLLL